jgi:hypothetical protein
VVLGFDGVAGGDGRVPQLHHVCLEAG